MNNTIRATYGLPSSDHWSMIFFALVFNANAFNEFTPNSQDYPYCFIVFLIGAIGFDILTTHYMVKMGQRKWIVATFGLNSLSIVDHGLLIKGYNPDVSIGYTDVIDTYYGKQTRTMTIKYKSAPFSSKRHTFAVRGKDEYDRIVEYIHERQQEML